MQLQLQTKALKIPDLHNSIPVVASRNAE